MDETLKLAGLKRGGARDRIIELLGEQSCAVSAIDIEEALRATGHPIARASIYRTLDLLVEHGLAERVTTGAGSRFEPVHPGGHHHHLICDQCGRLWPSTTTAWSGHRQARGPLGVRIESHDVLLRGDCRDCD